MKQTLAPALPCCDLFCRVGSWCMWVVQPSPWILTAASSSPPPLEMRLESSSVQLPMLPAMPQGRSSSQSTVNLITS